MTHWKEDGVPYSEKHKKFLTYPDYGHTMVATPEPFWTTLEILGENRGRSAVTIWMVDVAGVGYPMFLTDFVEMVKTDLPIYEGPGIYHGKWEFVKRGSNYGIRMVG